MEKDILMDDELNEELIPGVMRHWFPYCKDKTEKAGFMDHHELHENFSEYFEVLDKKGKIRNGRISAKQRKRYH